MVTLPPTHPVSSQSVLLSIQPALPSTLASSLPPFNPSSPRSPHTSPPYPHTSPLYPHTSPPHPHISPPHPHVSPLYPHANPLHPHISPQHHLHKLSPLPTPNNDLMLLRDLQKVNFLNCLHEVGVWGSSNWSGIKHRIR